MRIAHIILLLCICGQASWGQTSYIDSLRQQLATTSMPDTSRFMLMHEIANATCRIDPKRAWILFEKNLIFTKKLENDLYKANTLIGLGIVHTLLGNYVKALESNEEAITIYEKIGNKKEANIHLAKSYNNLSNLYHELDERDTEIEYLKKAIKLYEPYQDPKTQISLSNSLNNLGQSYTLLEKYDSAKIYINLAHELRKKHQPDKLNSIYNLFAYLAHAQKDYLLAYQYCKRIFANPKGFGYTLQEFIAATDFAKTYLALDSIPQAFQYAEKALKGFEEHDITANKDDVHEILSELYARTGNYTKAYFHLQEAKKIKETLLSRRKVTEIAKAKIKQYKKQKELENIKLQQQNQRQRDWIWILAVVSLVILGLLFYVMHLSYKRKRAYQTIQTQAQSLKEASEKITQLNEHLAQKVVLQSQSILDKDAKIEGYLYINAHKVRSPLANILGLVQIIENKQYENKDELLMLVDNIRNAAIKLDKVLFEINATLNEGLDA